MELPKRARTAKWENGVLTIDNVKQYQVSNLTMKMMEHFANYNLVGFHVSGYPITDDMIIPFKGHKSMVNFGVEYGAITDKMCIRDRFGLLLLQQEAKCKCVSCNVECNVAFHMVPLMETNKHQYNFYT